MRRLHRVTTLAAIAASTLALGACVKLGGSAPASSAAASPSPTVPTTAVSPISQWAASATATSNYGAAPGSSWNASNAVGPPEVTVCADNGKAWASLPKNTVETLTLKYAVAVKPTTIAIHESYNPGYVTSVMVYGGGRSAVVFTAPPAAVQPCPTTLTITVPQVDFKVDTVAVTVDQTALNNWSEIDAVQLTGVPNVV